MTDSLDAVFDTLDLLACFGCEFEFAHSMVQHFGSEAGYFLKP